MRSTPAAHAAAALVVLLGGSVAGVTSCDAEDPGTPAAPSLADPSDGAAADVGPQHAPFGLDARPANPTCKAPARPPPAAPVKFERVFSNVLLAGPMMLAQMPGDRSRMFAALRGTSDGGMGDIVSFPADGTGAATTVGSVGPLQWVTAGEGGFLGMAFHPKCSPQSCRLFVSFVGTGQFQSSRSVVGYLTSTDNGATFGGFVEILGFEETSAPIHRGGGIAFGNDGYLYVSFGDGGGADDGFAYGQNKSVKSAKVLRIDVDDVPAGQTYGIPPTNPFKNGGGEPALFAYGFRNPFRFSFDRATGDLWLGDVGQTAWEEIDRVEVGGNYGWPCREGAHPNVEDDPAKCPSKVGLIDPVIDYAHPAMSGRAVTGGVVYRGKAIPSFVGTYVYGDYVTGEVFTLTLDPTTGQPSSAVLADAPAIGWVAFSEDLDGEIYGVGLETGQLHKLVPSAPPGPTSFPDRLSATGCVDATDARKPAQGLIPYGVNAPLWSDGSAKERFVALPDGATIDVKEDGDFDPPVGTVLVKTFSVGGKRVETRLLVRHADGEWAGYSYEWLDNESDAVLLPSSKRKQVGSQAWYFPSRGECMRCHTQAAGRTLGLEIGQLNGDFAYPSTNRVANQLETLEHIQVLSRQLGKPIGALAVFPPPLGSAPTADRARAYLHANCSSCHRPQGGARGNLDLRYGTPFAAMNACNVDPAAGDVGVARAKLLVPGSPAKSVISIRPHALGAIRMPPLASSVVDDAALAVVDAWIAGVAACP